MICRSGAAQESAACGQHETCRAARARQQPRGKPLHRNTCGKIDARQNTIPQNADSRPGDPKRLQISLWSFLVTRNGRKLLFSRFW